MSKFIIGIIFLLLFRLPVLAQGEKIPPPPNYTGWELSECNSQPVLYEGKRFHALGAAYRKDVNDMMVFVYFEPMSEDQYGILKSLDQRERLKKINSNLVGTPLFVIYFTKGEFSDNIYIYEPSRRWYEVYRLWQSRLRFVKKLINPGASEDRKDSESLSKFIEQRYKIEFIKDGN